MLRDANHRLLQCVGLGVRADAVHFQKGERGGGTGPFVAVDISLRLGDVKGVGSREIVKIGLAVEVKLLRLKHGRLQPSLITRPGATPVKRQRTPVENFNLFEGEKERLAHFASRFKSSSCVSKTRVAAASKVPSSA